MLKWIVVSNILNKDRIQKLTLCLLESGALIDSTGEVCRLDRSLSRVTQKLYANFTK